METYFFDILSGTWWLAALLIGACIAIAVVGYRRTTPEISPRRRALLTVLRALGLSLLVLVLFEPVLRLVRSSSETPSVLVLVDASSSAALKDRGRDRRADVLRTLQRIEDRLGDRGKLAVFDGEPQDWPTDWTFDSIAFNGQRTDIGRAIRWAGNRALTDGSGAILVVSDGNTNTGNSPVFEADRCGVPVYSVGIGDTTRPKDIALSALAVQPVATIGVTVPLSVTVASDGFQGKSLRVEAFDGEKVVATTELALPSGRVRATVSLDWTPQVEGLRSIGIRAVPLEGEFTKSNNRVMQQVNVRRQKRTITLIAGAPSADVRFVIDAIRADPTVALVTHVMKPGGGFYEGEIQPSVLSESEAIVTVGFPIAGTPQSVLGMVVKAVRGGASLMWIGGATVDVMLLRSMEDVLPFSVVSARPRELMATVEVSEARVSEPVMRLQGEGGDTRRWLELPPIFRTETFVRLAPETRVLATIRVNNVSIDEPLIMQRDMGNARSLALLGHGIHRWKLLGKGPLEARGQGDGIDVLGRFLGNSIQWLSVRENDKRVRIRATREHYAAGEVVEIVGTVRDDAEAAVDEATVTVRIRGGGVDRTEQLSGLYGGRYATSIGALPAGVYSTEGRAERNGVLIGADVSRFHVGDLDLEALATTVDTLALSAMALRTGASWALSDNVDAVLDAILRDPRLVPVAKTRTSEVALWSNIWLLGIAILLFSIEWFVRKRNGLP